MQYYLECPHEEQNRQDAEIKAQQIERKKEYTKNYQEKLESDYKRYKRYKGFSLSIEEFETLTRFSTCTYCGDFYDSLGLDEVARGEGHTAENIVPCCVICNFMKNKYPFNFWLLHMRKIIRSMNKHLVGKEILLSRGDYEPIPKGENDKNET